MEAILIVDDSGFTRRTHRRILEAEGYVVHEAESGMSAIEGYFVHRPDLILLDLTMQDMGGLDVLTKLREMQADVPVIVISADVQRSTAQLVAESGAAFLGKPVSQDDLVTAVRTALAEARP